ALGIGDSDRILGDRSITDHRPGLPIHREDAGKAVGQDEAARVGRPVRDAAEQALQRRSRLWNDLRLDRSIEAYVEEVREKVVVRSTERGQRSPVCGRSGWDPGDSFPEVHRVAEALQDNRREGVTLLVRAVEVPDSGGEVGGEEVTVQRRDVRD